VGSEPAIASVPVGTEEDLVVTILGAILVSLHPDVILSSGHLVAHPNHEVKEESSMPPRTRMDECDGPLAI
jgi:hypothetical protein